MLTYSFHEETVLVVFFNIISNNIVETVRYRHQLSPFLVDTAVHQYMMNCLFQRLYTVVFHITTTRSYRIMVKRTFSGNVTFLIYNGPGLKSDKQVFSENQYLCPTFQCLLEAVLNYQIMRHLNLPLITSYQIVEHNQTLFLKGTEKHQWHIHSSSSQSNFHTLFSFSTEAGSHINVSVTNFSLMGTENLECLYGGIAFFDVNETLNLHKMIDVLCVHKKNYFHHLKNVYSDANVLLVVVYAYKMYSDLSLTLAVSSSSCQISKTNLCTLRKEHFLRNLPTNQLLLHQLLSINWVNMLAPELHVNMSGSHCVLSQFFVQPTHGCQNVAGLPGVSINVFLVNIFVRTNIPVPHRQLLQGVISNRHQNAFSILHWHDELLVGGPNLKDNTDRVEITRYQRNTKHKYDEMALIQLLRPRERQDFNDHPDVDPVYSLVPPQMSDWYFQMAFHSKPLSSENTLGLKLQMMSKQSWVDIHVLFENDSADRSVLTFQLPCMSKVPIPFSGSAVIHMIFLNSIHEKKLKIQIDIATKVRSQHTCSLNCQRTKDSTALFQQLSSSTTCLAACGECILPQLVQWASEFWPSMHKRVFSIAMQGNIHKMFMKSNKNITVHISATTEDAVQVETKRTKYHMQRFVSEAWNEESSWFSILNGSLSGMERLQMKKNYLFNMHVFIFRSSSKEFSFSKKFDPTHNAKTEFSDHLEEVWALPFLNIRQHKDNYPHPNCPNIVHKPSLIRWDVARELCRGTNETLPQFKSRIEQEEFIALLKYDSNMFPIDAVFVGLYRTRKVCCYLF